MQFASLKRLSAAMLAALLPGLAAGAGPAADAGQIKKVALGSHDRLGATRDVAAAGDTIVFSAPPRENEEDARRMFEPVAEYLSKALGKRVTYQYPGTWGVYRSEMLRGSYDLVFDGPHFNGYRADKLNHTILVKIPEVHEFVVITKGDAKYSAARELAGRAVCTHAPPNLGALVLLGQFDNPARQPLIVSTDGWKNIHDGVASGRCVAGVLPLANLRKFDTAGAMKVVYKSRPMPNQAFSASPRLTTEDQAKIAQALLAPQAAEPTARLRDAYKVGPGFAATNNQEYAGLAEFLRNEWGYY
jgi:ABC-type phosphate/phosphonate transport system substrate-binding protein